MRPADAETVAWHAANKLVVEGVVLYEIRHVLSQRVHRREAAPHESAKHIERIIGESFPDERIVVRATLPQRTTSARKTRD